MLQETQQKRSDITTSSLRVSRWWRHTTCLWRENDAV